MYSFEKMYYHNPIYVCHANGILPHLSYLPMTSQIKYMQSYATYTYLTWERYLNLGQVR